MVISQGMDTTSILSTEIEPLYEYQTCEGVTCRDITVPKKCNSQIRVHNNLGRRFITIPYHDKGMVNHNEHNEHNLSVHLE